MATRKSRSRHRLSSSLMLQQHLVSHYRHLQNVRPAIDTGHVTRQKLARQRSLRQLRLEQCRPPIGSDSTASLQLIDRILNDIHCPPQYYCHRGQTPPLPTHSEQYSETTEEVAEMLLAPVSSTTLQMPTDDESVIKKIDSYLSAVRTRRRFNLSSTTSGSVAGRRSLTNFSHTPPPALRAPPAPTAGRGRVRQAHRPIRNGTANQTSPLKRRTPAAIGNRRPNKPSAASRNGKIKVTKTIDRAPFKLTRSSVPVPSCRQSVPPLERPDTGLKVAPAERPNVVQPPLGAPQYPDQPAEMTTESPARYTDDETGADEPAPESRVPPLHMSPRSDTDHWVSEQHHCAGSTRTYSVGAEHRSGQHRSPHSRTSSPEQHRSSGSHVETARDKFSQHVEINGTTADHSDWAQSKDSAYNADFSCSSRAASPPAPSNQTTPPPPIMHELRRSKPAPKAGMQPARRTYRCCEEQAYVQFLSDVTSDILARGVFTNRIVKQVMAAHMERQRGLLSWERMRLELSHLREELGVPADNDDDDVDCGYGCCPPPLTPRPRSARSLCRQAHCAVIGGRHATAASAHLRPPAPSPNAPVCFRTGENLPAMSVPAFVDSILFPRGGGDSSATCSATPAPPHGGTEHVARLLGDLSLDESITQTILRCYDESSALDGKDSSTNSEAMQGHLSDGTVTAEAS